MDEGFVDLDLLINRIREPGSKKYFQDAVRSYKVGALRPALTSVWVAIVFDLIAKFRELSSTGDAAATAFLTEWDNATKRNDTAKLLKLEACILETASNSCEIIDHITKIHIGRIRDDRHLCAHPAFSSEAELFEPSHELARLHLVNSIEWVLSREPFQGRAVVEKISIDIQSPGFPNDYGRLSSYFYGRYLLATRPSAHQNIGVVLAKSLLKGVPTEWEPHQTKVAFALLAVRERSPTIWPSIQDRIVQILNGIEPERRLRAICFLGHFPDIFSSLSEPTQTSLVSTIENINVGTLNEFGFLSAVSLQPFSPHVASIIDRLTCEQLMIALRDGPRAYLWERALAHYRGSGSYRGSEGNFRSLIMPFAGTLNSTQTTALLEAVADNSQNYEAGQTPALLARLLKSQGPELSIQNEDKDRFCDRLRRARSYNQYADLVTQYFAAEGWQPPARTSPEE